MKVSTCQCEPILPLSRSFLPCLHDHSGVYSEVAITLTEQSGSTWLALKHTGVPSFDEERTREGWQELQFTRMKMILGFGAGITMPF